MGQKVNPHVIRLGTVHTWSSRWFDERQYKETALEDFHLRKQLMTRLRPAGISKVELERSINSMKIILHVSRPGIVIGRGGTGLEDLKKSIIAFFVKTRKSKQIPKLDIRVEPIKDANLEAQLVATNISDQLIRRLPYKRILTSTAERVMNAGAKGVKILLTGRIGGSEIARREKIHVGTVPLSTIRANISYAQFPAPVSYTHLDVYKRQVSLLDH